jgi:hypothetical protein
VSVFHYVDLDEVVIEGETMLKKIVIGAAVIGALVSASVVADTTTALRAGALECVGRVTTWQAYNECAAVPARHWDAIKNSASKYGNWASAGQWSKQSSCWANVVSYGYSLKGL